MLLYDVGNADFRSYVTKCEALERSSYTAKLYNGTVDQIFNIEIQNISYHEYFML